MGENDDDDLMNSNFPPIRVIDTLHIISVCFVWEGGCIMGELSSVPSHWRRNCTFLLCECDAVTVSLKILTKPRNNTHTSIKQINIGAFQKYILDKPILFKTIRWTQCFLLPFSLVFPSPSSQFAFPD